MSVKRQIFINNKDIDGKSGWLAFNCLGIGED